MTTNYMQFNEIDFIQNMMTPDWKFHDFDSPQKSKINYKSMPSFSGSGDEVRGVWQGSGFILEDLQIFTHSYKDDLEFACKCYSCHSDNILIIYLDHTRDQSGCDIVLELECLDCKKYTLAEGWN